MSRDIPLEEIKPDQDQPRRYFDPGKLEELAQSMKAAGMAVPILVRPVDDHYVIVHGERRYRAALALGWVTIPADVREMTPEKARKLSLIENIQRADLSPIEEAQEYRRWLDAGMTQTELGKQIGKSQSYIATKMRLLKLPEPIKFLLDREHLSEGHAKQLLRFKKVYAGKELHLDIKTFWQDGIDQQVKEQALNGEYFNDNRIVFHFLNEYRPGDFPIFFNNLFEDDCDSLFLPEVCTRLCQYMSKDSPKQWAIASTYWGSVAGFHGVSVSRLNKAIDSWTELFYTALWDLRDEQRKPPKSDSPVGQVENMIHWGRWSDLRHAGCSDWSGNVPDEVMKPLLDAILPLFNKGIPFPSSMQRYGGAYDKYMELRNELPDDYHDDY